MYKCLFLLLFVLGALGCGSKPTESLVETGPKSTRSSNGSPSDGPGTSITTTTTNTAATNTGTPGGSPAAGSGGSNSTTTTSTATSTTTSSPAAGGGGHQTLGSPKGGQGAVDGEFLKKIKDRYQEIAQKMAQIPLYKGVKTEHKTTFSLTSYRNETISLTPLEEAYKRGDLNEIKEIIGQAISLVNHWIYYSEIANQVTTKGQRPMLLQAMRDDKRDIFDYLVKEYKKLHLFSQKHAEIFAAASDECTKNENNCIHYLTKLLDEKYTPLGMKDKFKDSQNQDLKNINDRIDKIFAANEGTFKSGNKYIKLFYYANQCNLAKVNELLANDLVLVDWQDNWPNIGGEFTPLCMVSVAELPGCNDRYQIIEALLKKGANPNCRREMNPIFASYMELGKPNFLRYWDLFKSYDQSYQFNPFIIIKESFLARVLSKKSGVYEAQLKYIEEKFPNMLEEFEFRMNISTILAQSISSSIYDDGIYFDGGNDIKTTYKILKDSWSKFSAKLPDSYAKEKAVMNNKEILDEVNKSLDLSVKIAESDNKDWVLNQVIEQSKVFPVIIPAGWKAHAVAFVIYKNLFIKLNKGDRSPGVISGARFYEIQGDDTKREQAIKGSYLSDLIAFDGSGDLYAHVGKEQFDKLLDDKGQLHLKFISAKEEEGQCAANCTWESSANFALQLCLAILMTDQYTTKNIDDLVKSLAYDDAKEITNTFKTFAQYNIIQGYIDHSINTMGKNMCLPETKILTKVLKGEINKASSFLMQGKEDYFQQKTIDTILASGLPLASFQSEFSIEAVQANEMDQAKRILQYLAKKLGLGTNDFLASWPTIDSADRAIVKEIYDIYDPDRQVGQVTTYPWGQCYY